MTPIKNYEKLYSFPEVWKAIFQLIYGGESYHKKGIGDSEMEELQDILYGIMERQFYPKSFPKVWRALRFINKMYNPDDSSDNGTGGLALREEKSSPTKEIKIQGEP